MTSFRVALLALIASIFRTRAALQTEVFALRHQLAVLHANPPRRLRLKRSDRLLWVLLSRFWRDWRRCLQIVSTRDGRRLAPQSFRLVLDQEITTPPRKTGHSCGDSRLDSSHEPSEPAVGSTPHSRRTAQVGDQDGAIDGGQISAPTMEAAFADLASLSGESCGTDGFHRLLH